MSKPGGPRGAGARMQPAGNIRTNTNPYLQRGPISIIQIAGGTAPVLNLCRAVGNLDLIKLAVESHADTALRTKRGLNALDVACREGQLESVRILLAQNADVNRPLHLASGFGHTEVCRLLLEYGFDIESLST